MESASLLEEENKPVTVFIFKLNHLYLSKNRTENAYAKIRQTLFNKLKGQLPPGYYLANIQTESSTFSFGDLQKSNLSKKDSIVIAIEDHEIIIFRIVDQEEWILHHLQFIAVEGYDRKEITPGTCCCQDGKERNVFSHSLQDYLNAIDKINLNGSPSLGESIEGSPILEAEMVKE